MKKLIIISLTFAALTLISCGKEVIPMPGAEEGSDTTTGPNTLAGSERSNTPKPFTPLLTNLNTIQLLAQKRTLILLK